MVEHAFSCSCGGFPTLRHNDRDITASMPTAYNVRMEPELQPLTGEEMQHKTANSEEGAHLDTHFSGFWGSLHESAFFDVRVFSVAANTHKAWDGTAASVFYKRLASMLAEKQVQLYAKNIGWLWCTHSFSLMRSTLMCIRRSCSTWKRPDRPPILEIELAAARWGPNHHLLTWSIVTIPLLPCYFCFDHVIMYVYRCMS